MPRLIPSSGSPNQGIKALNRVHLTDNEFPRLLEQIVSPGVFANTQNSHHRYDVILLINGVPVVQIELKALQISTRRAMQQIVDYKNDPAAAEAQR